MSKVDKFINKALDEMFKYVGFDGFNKEFTEQEQWYSKKSWSEEDSNKFKDWFIKEFIKTFKSRKNSAEKEYQWFNLMWGWKVE